MKNVEKVVPLVPNLIKRLKSLKSIHQEGKTIIQVIDFVDCYFRL
jgi:hypothetical protein